MILFDLTEEIKQFLCSSDCKGWNDYASSPAECLTKKFNKERYGGYCGGIVQACSVCGFDQQIICGSYRLRIIDNRLIQIADITAADQFDFFPQVFQEKLGKGRSEEVPCVGKANG